MSGWTDKHMVGKSGAMGYPIHIWARFVLSTVVVSEGSQISGVHYPR